MNHHRGASDNLFLLRNFSLDLRSLALFRIMLGAVILCDLVIRSTVSDIFYSDSGILPRVDLIKTYLPLEHISLFLISGEGLLLKLLFVTGGVLALWFMVGFNTRYVTPCLWLFMVSVKARNPLITSGGDVLLQLLLFWSSFLPLDTYFSVSALRHSKPVGTVFQRVSAIGFVMQILLMYMFTFIWKCHPVWIQGEAMRDVLLFDAYVKPLGKFISGYPQWAKALTYAALLFEWMAPVLFLLSCPFKGTFRKWVPCLFILFHVFTFFMMELGTFSFISICAWIALIPSSVWNYRPGNEEVCVMPWNRSLINVMKEFIVLFLVVYIIIWNIQGLKFFKPRMEWFKPMKPLGRYLRLEQRWSMFAPRPDTLDGWFEMRGELKNGHLVNLLNPRLEVSEGTKPALVSAIYENHRLRKFCYLLRKRKYKPFREKMLRFYIKNWNRQQLTDEMKINKADFVFYMEKSVAGVEQIPSRKILARYKSPVTGVVNKRISRIKTDR